MQFQNVAKRKHAETFSQQDDTGASPASAAGAVMHTTADGPDQPGRQHDVLKQEHDALPNCSKASEQCRPTGHVPQAGKRMKVEPV